MKTEQPSSIACVMDGKVSAVCRSATPDDLVGLLSSLDQAFIYAKQRNLSLATRFPSTFCAANSKNIYICEEKGVIVSSLAIKHIEWQDNGQTWRGAMVGAVYTAPSHRGGGKASHLLNWTMAKLKSEGVDFTVLWTAQSEFYARLGWISADDGVLGEFNGDVTSAAAQNMRHAIAIDEADRDKIELIRRQVCNAMVKRCAEDYDQIPVPAETINVVWSEAEDRGLAYALVGTIGDLGIVYEMVGDKRCFRDLLSRLSVKHQRILINDCKGSESYSWLAEQTKISWQEKPLAMWQALSEQLPIERITSWYIPYFDRI